MPQRIALFGISLYTHGLQQLLADVRETIKRHCRMVIFTPNPEILVRAKRDRNFASLFTQTTNIPDGTGVQIFTGIPVMKGRIVFLEILRLAATHQFRVYLIGATDSVMKKALQRIHSEFPRVVVAGNCGPQLDTLGRPVSQNDVEAERAMVKQIREFKPDIVFVGFGAPKQEYWISNRMNQFPKTSFMAVGGTLDTFSGTKPLPPVWMERIGVEWLFRFIAEPQRVTRIVTAVFVFPFYVLISRLSKTV